MLPQRPRILPTLPIRDLVYRLSDAACIALGLAVALRLTRGVPGEQHLTLVATAIVVHYLVAEANGMYRSWRTVSAEREIVCILGTWIFTLPALLCIEALAGRGNSQSGRFLFVWGLVGATFVVSARMFLRSVQRGLRARGYNARRYAIIGANELGFELAKNVEDSPELGLKLVGFYDDRPAERLPSMPEGLAGLAGTITELVQEARQGNIDTVYIAFPMRAEARVRGILAQLSDTTASVYIVPDFFVFELLHSRWTNINGIPAVSVFENPFYGIDGLVKRGLDLVLSFTLLALLAAPMLAIALAVKLTSPGPVFFRQKRYGLDGREIRVWKFRTMRVCENGKDIKQATQGDPRVTPLGALLRRTSLDELPQLFNVIEGSMSLVGPRPHASVHNEAYRKLIHGYMLRHKVKPGITGLAQVNGWRGETDTLDKMEKRVEYDHRYIREWSLWMDLSILLRTLFVVFSHRNAY